MPKSIRSFDRMIIPAPCDADWDSMIGNDRVRFCEHCKLHVTNLTSLTRPEAMRLVARSEGRLCVRFLQRSDGGVATKEATERVHQIARQVSRIAAGAFTATLSLSSAAAQNQSGVDRNLQTQPAVVAELIAKSARDSSVVGTITDPNGAVITGATVTLSNNRTSDTFVFVTNEDGVYKFSMLASGEYTLNAEAPSFAKAQSVELTLSGASNRTVDISLEIPQVVEEVQVVSEESQVVVMGAGAVRQPDDAFIKAAFKNDLLTLVALIPTVTDLNVSDKATDTSALAYAVENNNPDMVDVLISAGALPNATTSKGETPLMFLSSDASVEFVRKLIALGADAQATDYSGRSVLMNAAAYCDIAIVKELVEAGARIDTKDNAGNTVLMSAVENSNSEILRFLVTRGAVLDQENEDGASAVSIAINSGRGENLKILLDAGASMKLTKEDLNKGLLVAAGNGDMTTAKILVERGADANAKNDETTVLMLVAENGSPQMVRALIDAGAQLNAVDDDGWTAIMHANEVENVRVLLNAGASMTAKNKAGETALAMAIRYDQTEIVALLKSRGAPQ